MDLASDEAEQLEFLLSRYLDGDLDQAARVELERRLEGDAELGASLEALRRTGRLVRAWAGPVPELDAERFVEEAARRRRVDDAWRLRRRILRLYGPLSAAAIILLAVTLYFAVRSPHLGAGGKAVALVYVHRADAWQHVPGSGQAFSEVSFDRRPPLETAVVPSGPRPVVAVAAAGVGPPVAEVAAEGETPYF